MREGKDQLKDIISADDDTPRRRGPPRRRGKKRSKHGGHGKKVRRAIVCLGAFIGVLYIYQSTANVCEIGLCNTEDYT